MASVADDAINGQAVNQMIQFGVQNQSYWNAAQQRNNDGINTMVERDRYQFGFLGQAVNAFCVQGVLGTNPTLADLTLAMRSVQAQPQTTGALINPGVVQSQPGTGGTGAQPTKAGTAA